MNNGAGHASHVDDLKATRTAWSTAFQCHTPCRDVGKVLPASLITTYCSSRGNRDGLVVLPTPRFVMGGVVNVDFFGSTYA